MPKILIQGVFALVCDIMTGWLRPPKQGYLELRDVQLNLRH